jgi:hypothetical protein
MEIPKEKDLWKQFNLGKNNPSPGGGILYCLRYSPERIEAHQESVISALENIGAEIIDLGQGLGISLKGLGESEQRRAVILLEELSVLNEAQEYHEAGFGRYRSISELKDGLICSYLRALERDQVAAYDLVDVNIPQIVRDISIADKQNKILNSLEREEIKELSDFARRQVEHMNHPGGYIVFG